MSDVRRQSGSLDLARLLKAADTFAQKQAKDSMGAGNPVSGSEKREAGSAYCPSCGRYHRLGTLCFNAKSITKADNANADDQEALAFIAKLRSRMLATKEASEIPKAEAPKLIAVSKIHSLLNPVKKSAVWLTQWLINK